MFMSCIGSFSSIVGKREPKYALWELACELQFSYELHKGNIKFYELVNIYCVQ